MIIMLYPILYISYIFSIYKKIPEKTCAVCQVCFREFINHLTFPIIN